MRDANNTFLVCDISFFTKRDKGGTNLSRSFPMGLAQIIFVPSAMVLVVSLNIKRKSQLLILAM